MAYRISFSAKAEKQFKKLPNDIQVRLAKKIDALEVTPRPVGVTKLSGEEAIYRIRDGDYSVVYGIYDHELLVLVVKIGHRRDIYS